jgi:hypothetical protein
MSVVTCGPAAQQLTSFLGFVCDDANPFVTVRNPADLDNWTQPVLELIVVAGAVLGFLHARRRLRVHRDPTNMALWVASLVYLFVIEPPLYFPEWFGLDKQIGFMFAHNVFTVQFMFDRLPLYIIAFYPALSQLAYEIVRALGVFTSQGPLAGSVCFALVYQACYEIFDHLGPQRKWWAWNLDNPANRPLLASVPLNSMWIFAAVSFGALTYLVVRLVGVPTWRGRRPRRFSLVWRTVLAGVLAPVAMVVASVPTNLFGGAQPNVAAQTVVLVVELAALWLVGAFLLLRQLQRNRATTGTEPADEADATGYLRAFPIIYLLGLAALWLASLPSYFAASGGVTSAGTPIGNLPYVVLCFAWAAFSLASALTATRARRRPNVPAAGAPVL